MEIALAQIRPAKADYAENLKRIGAVMAQVGGWPRPPGLVIFGETVMSGYFLEGGVRDAVVTAGTLFRDLQAVHEAAGVAPMDLCLGFYEARRGRIFNSALYAEMGGDNPGIRHVHRKVFLPTYGMFDEERFVDAGTTVQAFDTRWGRAAILICEDVWHSAAATIAALDGADFLIVPSASPARGIEPTASGSINSKDAWERIVRRVAEEHGVYLALVQIVGFVGGKGFQGGSALVGPDGVVLAEAPVLDEAIVTGRFDRRRLMQARADQPLLSDLEVALPHLLRASSDTARPAVAIDGPSGAIPRVEPSTPAAHPVVTPAAAVDPLAINAPLVERWLVAFLREEVTRRRGFDKVVIGLSGGVDSATTAALAVRAFGADNVMAVRLPYCTSATESGAHAQVVADALGLDLLTIDISQAVDGYHAAAANGGDSTSRGNVMARLRMIALFDLSAKYRALPLGTANKTERLLGYFTWHADDAPPVNPIGDLFKTQVLALARHLGIPDAIVEKPATADLVQGQTDEGDLGIAYARADLILHWTLSGRAECEIVEYGFSPDEVGLVKRRLDSTHWKRRLPTVAMLSRTAIGESYLRPVDY